METIKTCSLMKIKTYKGKLVQQPHFFILNKGMNSGSPNFKPYANCFVLLAETEKERNDYYWLCFVLWKTQRFVPSLTGSVVPFIRIRDFKTILDDAAVKVHSNKKEYEKFLSLLVDIDSIHEEYEKQLKFIKNLQKAVFKSMLKQ